jgi:molybdate transport system permease protein
MSDVLNPLWLSTKFAVLATLLTAIPAFVTGLLLARRDFRGKSLVETLVALPLVLPPTATGLMLLYLFGRYGPLGGLDVAFTGKAVIIALAVVSFPLVTRTARVAFEGVDPRLESMAASLGMSRWRVKARVTLPLAGSGLLAAALLGFSRALGEFGATVMVAGAIPGKTQTLAIALWQDIANGKDERARILLGISVVLAFATVGTAGWLQRRERRKTGRG